jgi:hypothetical protein
MRSGSPGTSAGSAGFSPFARTALSRAAALAMARPRIIPMVGDEDGRR